MSTIRTPLRYPGGKQKLAPFILEIIRENDLLGCDYAEPYAGGAGVALELLLSGSVAHIHLNDSCFGVYAFWRSILSDTEEFCRRISGASLKIEEWRRQKNILDHQDDFDRLDVGFSMFFLNRCNWSGVATAGPIGGINQDGPWKMDARFPRKELIRRIEAIAAKHKFITLKNSDAEYFILNHMPKLPKKSIIYCDPPYFKKSDRLYLNHYAPEDHARIAKVIQRSIKHPWIVSYDSSPEIQACYRNKRFFSYSLQYNASRAYKGTELFFFSSKLKIPTTSSVPCINKILVRSSL